MSFSYAFSPDGEWIAHQTPRDTSELFRVPENGGAAERFVAVGYSVREFNVRPHYHLVVLDGVFSEADDSEIAFHEAYALTPDRIAQVESVVQKRVLRYFRRRGLLDALDAAGMPGTRRRRVGQGSGGLASQIWRIT